MSKRLWALGLIMLALLSSRILPYQGLIKQLIATQQSKCTLSQQIEAANRDRAVGECPAGDGADTISLHDDVQLSEALPIVTSSIVIKGGGHTIDAGGQFRIFEASNGNLEIQELTLTGGMADKGGAIYTRNDAWLTLKRSSVVNNTGTYGRAIASEDSDLSVTESTFEKNKASSKGGAFFVKSTESYLWDSKIIGNSASQAGAGIYNIESTIFLTNIVIESNQHPRHGGGVYSRDGIMLFDNCTLRDNSAIFGGGIYSKNSRFRLEQCRISGNVASQHGGGIDSENGGFTISQSELSFNEASEGGAIYLTGGYRYAEITESTLQRNSAVFFGGGLAMRDGRMTIKSVTFRNNESRLYGGAIYSGSGSKLDVSNTTITRNSAKSYGGGVAVRGGTARLANITLVNNSAAVEGGGIFTRFATLRLHNSILAGNQFGDCSTFSEMDENINNLIQDGSCDPMLSGDPMLAFLRGTPAHYTLMAGSPATNAGHFAYCALSDPRGNARRPGARCDIGAVEMPAREDRGS